MHIRLIDLPALYEVTPTRGSSASPLTPRVVVESVLGLLRRMYHQDKSIVNVILTKGTSPWREAYCNRELAPPITSETESLLEMALNCLPLIQVNAPGADTNDLAVALSSQLAHQGHLVTLTTNNPLWQQLVRSRVRWTSPKKTGNVVELDNFGKMTGIRVPGQVSSCFTLSGFPSMGLRGVPGLDLKRAAVILSKYESLAGLLSAAEDVLTFSTESECFHQLMLPEWRALVADNELLTDFSQMPRAALKDIAVTVSEFEELRLYEVLMNLDLQTWQDTFSTWAKPFREDLLPAHAFSVKRAALSACS
jgi:5'-3' exonuclease